MCADGETEAQRSVASELGVYGLGCWFSMEARWWLKRSGVHGDGPVACGTGAGDEFLNQKAPHHSVYLKMLFKILMQG